MPDGAWTSPMMVLYGTTIADVETQPTNERLLLVPTILFDPE